MAILLCPNLQLEELKGEGEGEGEGGEGRGYGTSREPA